jgi:ATP-dependent DNA ligase
MGCLSAVACARSRTLRAADVAPDRSDLIGRTNIRRRPRRFVQRDADLDGELSAVRVDGITSSSELQRATDQRRATHLVYFAFDLLFLDGENMTELPLLDRKKRLQALLKAAPRSIQYSDHHVGDSQRFWQAACGAKAEGIISKRVDARYAPGNRGIWCKSKCYGWEEFIIIGHTEPEGSRPHLGALLLAYHDDAGQLLYAGRAGPACRRPSCAACTRDCSRFASPKCR